MLARQVLRISEPVLQRVLQGQVQLTNDQRRKLREALKL